MDIAPILDHCRQKVQARECLPFGPWPVCFKVCGKIFAQVYPDKLTLKCTRFQGELFRSQYPGVVVRGYHCPAVQQPYWNTLHLDRFPPEDIPAMLDLAYEAVVSGLPKKLQKNLKEIK